MGVRLALAGGLALLLAAVAVTLSGSPARVLSTNSIAPSDEVAMLHGGATVCQPERALPRGTSAVRVTLESVIGPRLLVSASSGARVLASGARGSGWTGADVTVPLRYDAPSAADATLCVTLGEDRETILMLGETSRPAIAASDGGETLQGRMRVEYLAPGPHTWWSQALPIARRLGLGRAPSGTWVAGLILALMAAVAALAAWLALVELEARRRVPRAALLCALVGCLNAVAWSILSPPFQVPDEPAHFAYVQQLAQAHSLPYNPGGEAGQYSVEEQTTLDDLDHSDVQFMPSAKTISTRAQQRRLERDLARPLPRRGSGYAGTATNEPPLYYAFEAIPYALASSGSLLDRLALMRLFSCVFGGLTALFAFMFVRETLPGVRWAWTVAGLAVALAPLLAFISGGVSPDGLLFAVSAALFYQLARAFRRGLTPALAAAICAVTVLGVLTKLNFLGLVPGVLVGLLVTLRRAPPGSRRVLYRAAGAALAVAAGALLVGVSVGPLSGGASTGYISALAAKLTSGGSVLDELSYTWQFYLPPLPGMTAYFPGIFTTRQLWFDGLVGLYGWADTAFPVWVYNVALIPGTLIGALWLRAMVAGRAALRRRMSELLVYATMSAGLLVVVGVTSYDNDVISNGGAFWEPRYLLPLLPLAAAALALAARGIGRRFGPALGAAIVVLVLGHDIFSQLLVVARYYG